MDSGMESAANPLRITGCKIFSATLARDRELMGEAVTRWIKDHPNVEIVDRTVKQSSDNEFHCLTVILWYRDAA